MTLPVVTEKTITCLPANSITNRALQAEWDVIASIQTCQQLLRRGAVANIALGLELVRAKLHLKHGSWYPYLVKVGIDPSGASRRMSLAKKYLQRSGLLPNGVNPADIMAIIDAGVERISINPAELHGLEKENLWDSHKHNTGRLILGVRTQSLFGFSLSRLTEKIIKRLTRRLKKSQYAEAAEALDIEANILTGWGDAMYKLAFQCSQRAQQIKDDLQKDEHDNSLLKAQVLIS